MGRAALMVAANLPDLDVLVFATSTPSVSFRRGWTHGVLAQVLLPVALAGGVLALGSLAAGPGPESPGAGSRPLPAVLARWPLATSASTPTSSSTT